MKIVFEILSQLYNRIQIFFSSIFNPVFFICVVEIRALAENKRQAMVTKNNKIQELLKQLDTLQKEEMVLSSQNVTHLRLEKEMNEKIKELNVREWSYDKALSEIGLT